VSARSKSRAPLRARLPKTARDEALRITAQISQLIEARAGLLRSTAAGMGLNVKRDNYRVTPDWQFFERVVIPLPKQVRRARRAQKKAS
jgi:hypothetical protein